MKFDDNENPMLPPCYYDNFYICQKLSDSYDLIDSLVRDILILEEEMVKWRYPLIPYLKPDYSRRLQDTIFSHLAKRHTNDSAYKAYLDHFDIMDPMESADHVLKLWRLAHGDDGDSMIIDDNDILWFR